MRKILLLLTVLLTLTQLLPAQKKNSSKQYQSLLWEITGNGLKQPSYLFGTMHVSDKMVFNLDDSFYTALKSAQVVALELDPGYWQEHYAKEDSRSGMEGLSRAFSSFSGNRNAGKLRMIHFSIDPYVDNIAAALNAQPTSMNAFLYRNNTYKMDYEENTYLDLHLYQTGMKLGKRVAGLENIDTSDALQKKANRAARKDRSKPQYDYDNLRNLPNALQEAYRKGDLDMLDSLQAITTQKQYREIFLFDRNKIQAHSVDTILKRGESVFAAVGAAHLPGSSGVIEELRRKGYKLRPITMKMVNSAEKDRIDKLTAPKTFVTAYTPDSLIKVEMPGPWYKMGTSRLLQHADMANGSYYTLYRLRTSALFWNETPETVIRRTDSLVYEKIAGKIQQKKKITVSGYPAMDITTLTRRGDVQRYQIIATPFELVVLKMSGNGDYVSRTQDADRFFNSVALKQLEKQPVSGNWEPAWGGFSMALPHVPAVFNKNTQSGKQVPFEYTAVDAKTNTSYNILREVLPRENYLEEDTFELNLMNESYMSSKMVEKELDRKRISVHGYPALQVNYKLNNGMYSQGLYIIQGAFYYSLVAQKMAPFKAADPVLASFRITQPKYPAIKTETNKMIGYTVQSPVSLGEADTEKAMQELMTELGTGDEEMEEAMEALSSLKSTDVVNDTIGESISLKAIKMPPYSFVKDSADWWQDLNGGKLESLKLKDRKQSQAGAWQVTETWYTGKNSSRMMHNKLFYKNGVIFQLNQYTDTLTAPSAFSKSFFSTFQPADTISGIDPFTRKGGLFLKEFASKDSVVRKRALKNLGGLEFAETDLAALKQITDTLSWKTRGYLEVKPNLISAIGTVKTPAATDYLKTLYNNVGDTAVFQQAVLNALLDQQTLASFKTFEELVTGNPPVTLENNGGSGMRGVGAISRMLRTSFGGNSNDDDDEYVYGGYRSGRNIWGGLYDTLQLTKQIMPGVMNLLNLDDYKNAVENLLESLADSNYLTQEMMQPYYTKYLLEAKQELKKLKAAESAADMQRKAKQQENDPEEEENERDYYRGNKNSDLLDKLQLLLPFYESRQPVRDLVQQTFTLKDKELKFSLLKLVLKPYPSAVPDTMLTHFAKDVEQRQPLYNALYHDSLLHKFPAAYATPVLMAESQFKTMQYKKVDSFVLAGKKMVTLKDKSGEAFVYKYRTVGKNSPWHWAVVGIIPADTMYTTRRAYDLDITDAGLVKAGKNEQKEVERLIKEAVNAKRPCAETFYRESYRNTSTLFEGLSAGGEEGEE